MSDQPAIISPQVPPDTDSASADAPRWPAIEDLLPHRPPMLLIDAVVTYTPQAITVAATPQADAWYVDADGNMPPWIAIELMAQAIAAHEALWRHSQQQAPAPGVLLGTRRLDAQVSALPAGVTLGVHAEVVLRDAAGNGAYDCRVTRDTSPGGPCLVEATVKVHQPSDFSAFLLEHTS